MWAVFVFPGLAVVRQPRQGVAGWGELTTTGRAVPSEHPQLTSGDPGGDGERMLSSPQQGWPGRGCKAHSGMAPCCVLGAGSRYCGPYGKSNS